MGDGDIAAAAAMVATLSRDVSAPEFASRRARFVSTSSATATTAAMRGASTTTRSVLPCAHAGHRRCLRPWFARARRECDGRAPSLRPVCRPSMPEPSRLLGPDTVSLNDATCAYEARLRLLVFRRRRGTRRAHAPKRRPARAAARGRRIAKVGERRWRQVFLARTQELGDQRSRRRPGAERRLERLAEGARSDELATPLSRRALAKASAADAVPRFATSTTFRWLRQLAGRGGPSEIPRRRGQYIPLANSP